ncbi:MAG: DHA2 family efflux MFS transporter permease subunit [Sphingopyxis sp.]
MASAAAPDHDQPLLSVRHRGLLMVAVMGASVVQFLDATIANVALPHMQTSLGASIDSVTWVLTSFIIASAVATPIVGWLADRVGTRALFLIAVAGFTAMSMLCGAAMNLSSMVAFRIGQGVFAAMIGPLSQSIMLDISKPSEAAKTMAIWGMGVMIAPITGPMLGGWLTESYSWRWVFYVNLPVGIPTLALLWWLLPSRPVVRRRLDYWGYALFALGLGALQLMLDRGGGEDWFQSSEIIVEAGVAAACLWMFGVHMMTAKAPLFPAALIRNTNFMTSLIFMLMMGVVLIALSALLPPMLQNLFGYSVLDTGLMMAPRGAGVLISMVIATRMISVVGPRILIAGGFAIAAASLWLMSGWSLDVDWRMVVWTGLFQGMGMGLCFMPLNVLAFSTIPTAHRTDGSGLMNLMRSLGASIGISLMTTMLARNIQTSHADLAAHVTPGSVPGVDLSSAGRLGEYGDAVLLMLDGLINKQAAMIAYIDDFWMMALVVGACVPLVFLAREPKRAAG